MACALLIVFPSWLLVKYLKRIENVDYYDVNTNFNPFVFGLAEEENEASNSHSVNTESSLL